VLLLGINWLLARHQFEPIDRFLKGEATFESPSGGSPAAVADGAWVGIFALVLYAFRNSSAGGCRRDRRSGSAHNHRRLHRRLPAAGPSSISPIPISS